MRKEIVKCKNIEELARNSADYIYEKANNAISNNGIFSIALAGGKSPLSLYQLLESREYSKRIDWKKVHIFWSDERCVPPTHSESNYKMACDLLLSKILIPEKNIHRIRSEIEPPNKAASFYEDNLKEFFSNPKTLFDLCLLGIGADGHTASIFPGAQLDESKLVVASKAPEQVSVTDRVTLTTSAINRSKSVAFIVSGRGKEGVLKELLSGGSKVGSKLPAAKISPTEDLVYFIDESSL